MATTQASKSTNRRSRYETRWGVLKAERESWISHYREISRYIIPRSGRYYVQDRNRGQRRHQHIYDNTGSQALRVLGSGMMAGATSPARPWFRLAAADPDLNKHHQVRLWLDDCARRVQIVFAKSNTYRALHQIYEELGAFGTACDIVLPDFENVIHHYPITAGEYALQQDYQGRIVTMYREFEKTVGELVAEFGYEKCSQDTQELFDKEQFDTWRPVVHAIEKRLDRRMDSPWSSNKPYASVYFERSAEPGRYLRESGFDRFPVLAPRWSVSGQDVYGSSPGMEALGDVKGLQHKQLRLAQAIDFQTKPPLQAPTSLKNRDLDMLPGGISFVDAATPQTGIRPAFDASALRLDHLQQSIADDRDRIRSSFFSDLFLMLYQSRYDPRKTATEVAELHEEKLIMLGPVLERLHTELLQPLIETTFARMLEVGAVAPPPPEMSGMGLNVEFVSMLAQAQRAVGTNAIDRFVANLGAISEFAPEVLDRFKADEWAKEYPDLLGVTPRLLRSDEEVQKLRDARAQAQAAQAQNEMMAQQAKATRDLASASTAGGDNVLTDIMSQFSGYSSPAPAQVR